MSAMNKLTRRPEAQIMDDTIQPEEAPRKEKRYNPIDCGCLEGCTKFCFWAGAPACLALIILARKLMPSGSDYTK